MKSLLPLSVIIHADPRLEPISYTITFQASTSLETSSSPTYIPSDYDPLAQPYTPIIPEEPEFEDLPNIKYVMEPQPDYVPAITAFIIALIVTIFIVAFIVRKKKDNQNKEN